MNTPLGSRPEPDVPEAPPAHPRREPRPTPEHGAGPDASTFPEERPAQSEAPTRSWKGWSAAAQALGLPGATRAHVSGLEPDLDMSITMPEVRPIRVPGFDVLEEIGRGGMGIVYRARKHNLGNLLALKVLPPAFATDATRLERFLNEGRIAAGLTDARILPVLDMVWADGLPVLVMPFVEGADLSRILKDRAAALRGRVSDGQHSWCKLGAAEFQERLLPVLDQLVDAVVALHEAHVIHRDIKPSNCLVDARGNLWLSDFGLAKLTRGMRQAHTSRAELGTPGYMSPEAWEPNDTIDARADVFSLGVTLYQCLTLELPYGRERVLADTSLPTRPFRRHPEITPELDVVILKAIEPSRERRYADGVQLREDWRRARHGLLPRYARPPSLLRVAGSQIRRRKAIVMGVSPIAMALLGLSAYPWIFPRPPAGPLEPRRVTLNTTIPCRRLAYIPLNRDDGEPMPHDSGARRLRGARTEWNNVTLVPGNYLITVEWPDGRFHEVYRSVPKPGDSPSLYNHLNFWERDGVVALAPVAPPPPGVESGMAAFAGHSSFPSWLSPNPTAPQRRVAIAPFLLDPSEFSVADFLSLRKARGVPVGLPMRMEPRNPRDPWPGGDEPIRDIEFDAALHYIELVGKRLPSLDEYQSAIGPDPEIGARADRPGATTHAGIRPVEHPELDRLPTDPPVVGLRSNVGEWTTSWGTLGYQFGGQGAPPELRDLRIVFGAPPSVVTGHAHVEEAVLGLRLPVMLPRRQHWLANLEMPLMNVGFRGARSLRPRFLDEADGPQHPSTMS